MSKIETFIGRYPDLAHWADGILPELIKGILRKVLLHEKYPLSEPFLKKIDNIEAAFWINNPSDWYRIAHEGFENEFSHELLLQIKPGTVFVDIGAAQGLYTIFAAKLGARVFAFDPDPVSYKSLQDNIELNQDVAERIIISNTALGIKSGQLQLHIDETGTYAPSLKRTAKGLTSTTTIQVITLDEYQLEMSPYYPEIIKIDVEGSEELVLLGMEQLLTSDHKPHHIFIELHPQFLPQFDSSTESVIALLNKFGYTPATEIQPHREKELHHFIIG